MLTAVDTVPVPVPVPVPVQEHSMPSPRPAPAQRGPQQRRRACSRLSPVFAIAIAPSHRDPSRHPVQYQSRHSNHFATPRPAPIPIGLICLVGCLSGFALRLHSLVRRVVYWVSYRGHDRRAQRSHGSHAGRELPLHSHWPSAEPTPLTTHHTPRKPNV
jgi:hypothetical protein